MQDQEALVAADDATTRSLIVDAAKRCFASSGFKGASIKKIAATAGVPAPALIYYYFPSKADLFAAVIKDGAERSFAPVRRQLVRVGTVTEVLRTVAEFTEGLWRNDPDLLRVIVQVPVEMQHNPELATHCVRDPLDQLWSDLLGQIRVTAVLPSQVGEDVAFEMFRVWFTGLANTFINRESPELQPASDLFNTVVGSTLSRAH